MKINIITLFKENPEWKPSYVYNLHKSLEKNLTIPFNFICLTDSNKLEIINTIKLDPLPIAIPGYWYKIQLFKQTFTNPCLFFDLDTIIKGNFDSMISDLNGQTFSMILSPFRSKAHSSCIMWWQGDHRYLWEYFKKDPIACEEKYKKNKSFTSYGDQKFISDNTNHTLIQDIISNPQYINRLRKKESTDSAKILICSGNRRPWSGANHPDIIKHWKYY